MISCLSMYDRAETAQANNRFWSAIRTALGYGPASLTRDRDLWQVWQSPDLLLAQTCGFPYRAHLHEQVTLVATPDYGLPGCAPGHYNSVLVAHKSRSGARLEAFDNAHLAYNEPLSQSGWAAPVAHFADNGLRLGTRTQSGAHVASARLVAQGKADIAAVDALSWELICRYDPFAAELTEITRTAPTPALPFITAFARDPAPLQDAIAKAIHALSDADRAILNLHDLVSIPKEAYLAIPTPAAP